MLTFEQLRKINVQRCNAVFHPVNGIDEWSPCDWATAMGGECGEALNEVKKLRRLDNYVPIAQAGQDTLDTLVKVQKHKIGHELADLIIYADLLAARLGINLSDVIIEKFNIISDKNNCNIKLEHQLKEDLDDTCPIM